MQSVLSKVAGPTEVQPQNLQGRTAIIVGGAYGIGYEISRALAHAGCKVIMVNRKEEQAEEALSNIKKETPDADVDWKECDLGSLVQVRAVFSKLRGSLDRLDFLVLSAGISPQPFALDEDGIDRHFGVNYLGQYYATNQLWPLIRKTSNMPGVTPPRIVSLASELHKTSPSDLRFASLDEINNPETGPTYLYGRTKLALILFTRFGLVERVIKPCSDAIYALSVHPGTVRLSASPTLDTRLTLIPGQYEHAGAVERRLPRYYRPFDFVGAEVGRSRPRTGLLLCPVGADCARDY